MLIEIIGEWAIVFLGEDDRSFLWGGCWDLIYFYQQRKLAF